MEEEVIAMQLFSKKIWSKKMLDNGGGEEPIDTYLKSNDMQNCADYRGPAPTHEPQYGAI